MLQLLKAPVRPMVRQLRQNWYTFCFHRANEKLQNNLARSVMPHGPITADAHTNTLWTQLEQATASLNIQRCVASLSTSLKMSDGGLYWQRYGKHYANVGQGREKALEHALTFELLDFSQVRRYCDVAAATSPIEQALSAEWPQVEYWKQDMLFETDVSRKIIGGSAQAMQSVESGFFDALTLHCSFEHFYGSADVEFVPEVDRVLSPIGACLILPLYVGITHRIFFDPTMVSVKQVNKFDAEGELRPVYGFRQEHGRYYSPASLVNRLLNQLPSTLQATLIRFTEQNAVDPSIYLNFALILHRPDSVFCRPS